MVTWSAIRHKLENEYLSESLRGHIRYFATTYRESHDQEGRAAIYYDGQGYMEARQMEQLDHYVPDPNMAKYMRNTRKCVPDLMEKFRQENRAMDKVQAVFACAGEKEQAFRRIREMEGVEATGALSYNIEVTAGGINKGEALLWLAGELGIDREEILAKVEREYLKVFPALEGKYMSCICHSADGVGASAES